MAVLVSDSFNRANDATTLGNTDSYNGGTAKTWAPSGTSVWGISSNQAYRVSNSNDIAVWLDAGVSDCKVSVTLAVKGSVDKLVFRYVSDASCWFLQVNAANYTLVKHSSASVWTTLATIAVTPVAGDQLAMTLNGSTVTLTINGANGTTVTDAFNQTVTKFGLMTNGNARFDNFQVEDLATGTTGSATLQGVGTLTASGTMTQIGSASLQGVGTLSASGTVIVSGSANLQGVGTLSATGTTILSGSASLQGVGTLSASGSGTSPNPTGSATLQGVGTLVASGVMTISGSASLMGVGTLTASGLNIKKVEILRTVNLQGDCINAIALQGEFITSVLLIGEMINKVALEGEI